jgi:hypothetical protein
MSREVEIITIVKYYFLCRTRVPRRENEKPAEESYFKSIIVHFGKQTRRPGAPRADEKGSLRSGKRRKPPRVRIVSRRVHAYVRCKRRETRCTGDDENNNNNDNRKCIYIYVTIIPRRRRRNSNPIKKSHSEKILRLGRIIIRFWRQSSPRTRRWHRRRVICCRHCQQHAVRAPNSNIYIRVCKYETPSRRRCVLRKLSGRPCYAPVTKFAPRHANCKTGDCNARWCCVHRTYE